MSQLIETVYCSAWSWRFKTRGHMLELKALQWSSTPKLFLMSFCWGCKWTPAIAWMLKAKNDLKLVYLQVEKWQNPPVTLSICIKNILKTADFIWKIVHKKFHDNSVHSPIVSDMTSHDHHVWHQLFAYKQRWEVVEYKYLLTVLNP